MEIMDFGKKSLGSFIPECVLDLVDLNPRTDTVFRHLRSDRGGGCDPSWRFQTKRRRASRKRPADCSRRVLAIGGIMFGPRSIFHPVMAG